MKKIIWLIGVFSLLWGNQVLAQELGLYQRLDTLTQIRDSAVCKTSLFKRNQIEVSENLILKAKMNEPSFSVYRDNYFVTGIPLNKKTSNSTADALFQVSIRQRITRDVLPYNSFLYITYTQKSLWNIYAESSPFRDNNYNPGIGLGRCLVIDNKFKGATFIQIEHESNGQGDSIMSRSWNYLSLAGKYFFNPLVSMQLKVWVPFVDGGANQDLLDYRGLGIFSLDHISKNDLWWFSLEANPRKGFGNVNIRADLGFRLSKRLNQYLFIQYYNGYAEGLLDYKEFTSQLRLGFCIKPDFYSVY